MKLGNAGELYGNEDEAVLSASGTQQREKSRTEDMIWELWK